MSVFSDRLRQLRLDKGENQSNVAALLGVSAQSYSAYEGSREPKYALLCKIAKHYNVTTDYLLGASNAKNPESTDIMKVTGLSEKAIEFLKKRLYYDKYNSITLTVNTLLENKKVLHSIAHYLYYVLDEGANKRKNGLGHIVPYYSKYKYLDYSRGCENDIVQADATVNVSALGPGDYRNMELLKVLESLRELYDKESKIDHFKK